MIVAALVEILIRHAGDMTVAPRTHDCDAVGV